MTELLSVRIPTCPFAYPEGVVSPDLPEKSHNYSRFMVSVADPEGMVSPHNFSRFPVSVGILV